MICPHCGSFFCDDTADITVLGKSRRIFCSPACSRNHKNKVSPGQKEKRRRARRRKRGGWLARTEANHARGKTHYSTESQALTVLHKMQRRKPYPHAGVYKCCELGYQVTKDIR